MLTLLLSKCSKCLNFLVFKNYFIESLQPYPTYSWEAYVKSIATQKQMKVCAAFKSKECTGPVSPGDYFSQDKNEKS